jgi:hypothetical protein
MNQNSSVQDIEQDFSVKKAELINLWSAVEVVGQDETRWQKAPDFPVAYFFVLKLSKMPTIDWKQVFDQQYGSHLFMSKRKARVVAATIELVVADSDNLQGHVDFVKTVVSSTNEALQRHLRGSLLPKLERDLKLAIVQHETLVKLAEESKNLVFWVYEIFCGLGLILTDGRFRSLHTFAGCQRSLVCLFCRV